MTEFCPRSVSFTIPGVPGVQVTAVEDNGAIDFTVDVVDSSAITGDLRGLFFQFNESKLSALQIINTDGLITGSRIAANSVIDLGNGDNMNGAASPFDVGINFGKQGIGHGDDISFPVRFTLTDNAHDLTLDDFAHLQFGARVTSTGAPSGSREGSEKIVTLAPAAPDAKDDAATTHEDTAIKIFPLANDISPDGRPLVITEFHQDPGSHGTVTITDNGQSITFTPDKDYAGLNIGPTKSIDDSFVYCVSDGNGGEDHATVNLHIIPVADPPDIKIDVLPALPNDPINMVRLHITATAADIDGSETITGLALGALPGDVTLTSGNVTDSKIGVLDSLSQDIQLTLPTDHTTSFDFGVTATSAENGNGDPDTASNTAVKHIELDVAHNTATETLTATNQSIWDPSLPGRFDDDRFIGLNVSGDPKLSIEPLGSVSGHYELQVGFQSTLHATFGDINATLPYDITINTLYNQTTDALLVDPSAVLDPTASFLTHGPGGSYDLSFIFHALLSAHGDAVGIVDIDKSIGPLDLGFNILDINSAEFHKIIDLPPPPLTPYATLTLNWPQVDTTGGLSPTDPNILHSDGKSPDIVNLNLDLIGLALAALGISPNPLDLGVVDLLSLHVNGGVDVTQHFDLTSLGLEASLKLEDGYALPVHFGTPVPIITNAKSHDTNGDNKIDVSLHLSLPNAQLHNETDLGFNVGASLDLLTFPDPFGTLVHLGGDFPLGEIPLYQKTLGLAFNTTDYGFGIMV